MLKKKAGLWLTLVQGRSSWRSAFLPLIQWVITFRDSINSNAERKLCEILKVLFLNFSVWILSKATHDCHCSVFLAQYNGIR